MHLRFGGLIGRMSGFALHLSVQSVGIGVATVIAMAVPAATWGMDRGANVAGTSVDRTAQLAASAVGGTESVQLGDQKVLHPSMNPLIDTQIIPTGVTQIASRVSVQQLLNVPSDMSAQLSGVNLTRGVLLPFSNPVCTGCVSP